MTGVTEQGHWATLPFEASHSTAFNWTDSDSLGMAEWVMIRERWSAQPSEESPLLSLEMQDSVFQWWLKSGDLPVVVWGMVSALAVGLVLRWIRLKHRKNQTKVDWAFDQWPALALLASSQAQGAKESARKAAADAILGLLLPAREQLSPPVWPHLNDSEAECAHHTLQRLSTREIAEIMHCTTKHVYNLRTSIRKKLDIPTSADLVAELMRRASSPNFLSSRDGKLG
jgi:DNA-binding CsgD family transcriptional regulator